MSMSPEEGVSKLTYILDKIHGLLQMEEYDERLRDELSKKLPNYMTILENRKKDIIKKDASIVVTGETSAGKTSLINCLLGEKIFVVSNVACTSKIYRIRNSDKLACKYYTKQDELKIEVYVRDLKELKKLIKKGTDVGSMNEEDQKSIYFVDVFMPFSVLEGDVILVDTPGTGESEEFDKILLDILPDAVSFIFVVNARNAGGVQKWRLLEILRSINENREKMPCFDHKEVLFVTNQWDIVDDDTDEDDEEENSESGKQRTWIIMKEKLSEGWPEINEANIFRVTLKQVMSKRENEYSSEFKRFQVSLHRNIKRNNHKRLKNHFRFLEKFMQYAEAGTLAGLAFLSMSESDKCKEIKKVGDMIDDLEGTCKTKYQDFVEDCNCKVDRLASELWDYLHSSYGKEEILNPSGITRIENISYIWQHTEIPRRVEAGVSRWLSDDYCRSIMMDAENKIVTYVMEMNIRIQKSWAGILGDMISFQLHGIAEISVAFGLLSLFFPVAALIVALFAIILTPLAVLSAFIWGAEWHKTPVDNTFVQCVDSISRGDLQEKFKNTFGREYLKIIHRVFLEDIPKEINTLRVTLKNLESEQQILKEKEDSLKILRKEIKKIRKEMTEMHVSLSEMIDQ
ncbi:uncharacterized protein LOC134250941 [Saccostrea cucullata]|uniref:uncharacterized protein LOC134250941 n=1 Tax=Saccostrea cuccullata TaxID=36930 RepID=UPI002ED1431B